MSHEVETMVYVREVPWHGLGTRVDEAMDSETALVKSGLLWAVESRPIVVNGQEVPGYRANVRSTDGAILGIVSESYRIVQNAEAFSFTDLLVGEGVTYETAGSLRGGKRIWLLAKLPEDYKILGDDFRPYVCFTNSHDGTQAVKVILTPVRVVCQNTLTLALSRAHRTWTTRHLGDVNMKLQEARRTLGLAQAYFEALGIEAEKLVEKKANIEELVKDLFPIDKSLGERAVANAKARQEEVQKACYTKDLKPFWGTGWAWINGVADVVSHMEPQRKTETWKERRFESILDGPMLLNQAYALVTR